MSLEKDAIACPVIGHWSLVIGPWWKSRAAVGSGKPVAAAAIVGDDPVGESAAGS